jgi:hypothetical protein
MKVVRQIEDVHRGLVRSPNRKEAFRHRARWLFVGSCRPLTRNWFVWPKGRRLVQTVASSERARAGRGLVRRDYFALHSCPLNDRHCLYFCSARSTRPPAEKTWTLASCSYNCTVHNLGEMKAEDDQTAIISRRFKSPRVKLFPHVLPLWRVSYSWPRTRLASTCP